MALQDRLFDDLRVSLPGSTDAAIKQELWATLDDLCRDGHVWRETITVALVVNQDEYLITPAGTEIVHVFAIDHPTLDLTNVTYEYGKILIASDSPLAADTTSPLFVVAALTPSLNPGADVEAWIPSDMWSEHYQTILSGVKARMMAQPAKPYSNPQVAVYHARDYRSRKAVARHRVRTGGVPGAQMWRFPSFSRARGA